MKKWKVRANGILLCLFELIVGILLMIDPVRFTSGIIAVAGVVLLILGLGDIIRYFRTNAQEAAVGQQLAKGLLSLLGGGFCVLRTDWFILTFPVLTILYGVVLLVTGMGKIQLAVDKLRQKNKKWFWAAISAAVSIVCAAIILQSPFSSTAVLWMFTGVTLLVESVIDILALIFGKKGGAESEAV